MIRTPHNPEVGTNDYPTTDARIMPESDWHKNAILALIDSLRHWFRANPNCYIGSDNLVFFEPGNKRKHVAPDVYFVPGVPNHERPNFLIWEEGQAPTVVVEIISKTTKRKDCGTKLTLYRDVIKVQEYFLFDPKEEALKPSMQGFRLVDGEYQPISPVAGRLPSAELGLHLERVGSTVRWWDPETETRVPTSLERVRAAEGHADALVREVERLRRLLGEARLGAE